jgi:hypothetical protein
MWAGVSPFSPGADVGGVSPSPGAGEAGSGPVPVRMWPCRRRRLALPRARPCRVQGGRERHRPAWLPVRSSLARPAAPSSPLRAGGRWRPALARLAHASHGWRTACHVCACCSISGAPAIAFFESVAALPQERRRFSTTPFHIAATRCNSLQHRSVHGDGEGVLCAGHNSVQSACARSARAGYHLHRFECCRCAAVGLLPRTAAY